MIPVFEPVIGEEEIEAVTQALRRGEVSGNFGEALHAFEEGFARFCGVKHGIACTSGTTALHLAVAAAGLKEGDEILISESTNIATALAVIHNGFVPVPVDSENETWNLDLDKIEALITPRTRAIIPVHLFGHPVDMDRLMEIANRHKLLVIEDAAEAHGATVRGRRAGGIGQMGCFSFYANKIITTGEGGMVVTDDDAFAAQLRLLRNLAFTKPRFRHAYAGFNFRMAGYQGAMGLAQLRKIDAVIERKRALARLYHKHLAGIPGLRLPPELPWAKNVYWMYAVLVEEAFGRSRDELSAFLEKAGIETRTFFCPMSDQPCLLERKDFRPQPAPVATRLWQRGLYLPSAYTLGEDKVALIAAKIREARG